MGSWLACWSVAPSRHLEAAARSARATEASGQHHPTWSPGTHACSMGPYPGLHHGSGLLSQGKGCGLQVSSLEAPCLLCHPAPPILSSSPTPAPPSCCITQATSCSLLPFFPPLSPHPCWPSAGRAVSPSPTHEVPAWSPRHSSSCGPPPKVSQCSLPSRGLSASSPPLDHEPLQGLGFGVPAQCLAYSSVNTEGGKE